MKKIPVMIGSLAAACTAFLVFLSFFLLSLQNMDLPKMTNPRIVIKKAARSLEVYDNDRFIKSYKMVLGFKPAGDKQVEGDGKTPEGKFYIFTKNTESKFHLSPGISYPGPDDAKRGLDSKFISQEEYDEIVLAISEKRMPLQKTKLGGEIYIHGGGTRSDWTEGCIALVNEEITELFNATPLGTEVEIKP